MLPPHLLKIAIAGTKRIPPDETTATTLQNLDLPRSHDPTTVALEALATGFLRAKAGFQASENGHDFFAAPPETLKTCSLAAGEILKNIFSGGENLGLLDEFLEQCRAANAILPAEILPLIFNKFDRDFEKFEKIRPVLGRRGEWLAAQNPAWSDLFSEPKTDWQTGLRDERIAILKKLRRENPAAAAALLETTWPTEKADDKKVFLQEFQVGLNENDLPLLEKTLDDRSREVRQIGWELVCQLPGEKQKLLADFFSERIAPALQSVDFQKVLLQNIPSLEEHPAAALVSLLPAKSVGESWRLGIAGLILGLLPPRLLTNSPENFVEKITAIGLPDSFFENFLGGAIRHRDEVAMLAGLQFLKKKSAASFWEKEGVADFLDGLPLPIWKQEMPVLLRLDEVLENEKSALLRHLSKTKNEWSWEILAAFFWQISNLLRARSEWSLPVQNWKMVLKNAALRCQPTVESVEISRTFFFQEGGKRQVWPRDGHHFSKVLEMRGRMKLAFG